MTDLLTYWL